MSTDPARKPLSAAFMNITFSPSTSPICTHATNSSNTSLSIAIRTLPQTKACFNLASTFSQPDQTYTSKGTGRCDAKLGLCGIKYTVFDTLTDYDSDNIEEQAWDNVFYTQVRNPLDKDGVNDGVGSGGRLELTAYSGDDCEEGGDGGSARWNCVDGEGSCNGVGFGVRSFEIKLMAAEDVGMGSCVVAATGGAKRWTAVEAVSMVALGVVVSLLSF